MKHEDVNFVQTLFNYVNQEIADFKHSIMVLAHIIKDIRVNITYVCEIAQAMLEEMEKGPQ